MSIVLLVTSAYFHFFEARNNAYDVKFFRASFLHPITDTDSMRGHAPQIF